MSTSALPKAVQAQVDKANELVAQMQPPAPDAAAAPVPNPPAAAPKGGDPVSILDKQVQPPESPPQPPSDWEHKYNVLQGKYNAEVPRLTRAAQESEQRLRELTVRLDNTQTLLASLNPAQSAQKPSAPATPPARLVKDEEVQAFGPDLIDVMRRVTKEETASKDQEIADLKQQLDGLGQTVKVSAQVAERTEEEKVIALLNERVPKWEQQNTDAGFHTWLDECDPFGPTGVRRGELLGQAFSSHDGPRVVAFFQGYLNENAAVTPPASDSAPATPPEGQSLEGLVAPGNPKQGANQGAPSDHAGKRVWNQADAQQLYKEINEYTKKGKAAPKELKVLELDLIAAQKEGRIST